MAQKEIRPIRVEGNIAYIPLTKGYEAMIDAEDAPIVSGVNWRALVALKRDGSVRAVYAVRDVSRGPLPNQIVYMHRMIFGGDHHLDVDHITGNGLDNRKANLRLASRSENLCNQKISAANTSGDKGVYWHKRDRRWCAQIMLNGQNRHLGSFLEKSEASAAYALASETMHGAFGRT